MDNKLCHIVCIDDEDAVRESLERILQDALGQACIIDTASSGEEGLALVDYLLESEQKVALVLSDQRMPDKEGIQVLHIIQNKYPMIKRVLVTAYGQDIDLVKRAIAEAQVDGFIDKPVYPPEEKLLPLVRRLLSQYQAQCAAQAVEPLEIMSLGGATEASIWSIIYPIEQVEPQWNSIPYGYPLCNQSFYVLNQHLEPCPDFVPGDLYIGGIGLAKGYWKDDAKNKASFIIHPQTGERLYRTGDTGCFRPEGYIEFLGREDSQVKIRGYRIELGEIEQILKQQLPVAEAIVVIKTQAAGPALVAYILPKPGYSMEIAALQAHLAQQLPAYMHPQAWVILSELPLTPNGKVDKKALPAPVWSAAIEQVALPRNETEQALVNIWAEVLVIAPSRLSIRANFFEMGGHSILAVALMAKINQAFAVNLPLATLFTHPTIEALSPLLTQEINGTMNWSSLVGIQTQGSQSPLFCIPGLGGNVIGFYALAQQLGPDQPVYGLQSVGLDGMTPPLATIEAISAHYVQAIQAIQSTGPYYLLGHSFGGQVAYEMARQLQQQGQSVGLLGLVDSFAPMSEVYSVIAMMDTAAGFALIAQVMGGLFNQVLPCQPVDFAGLDEEAAFVRLHQMITNSIPLLSHLALNQLKGLVKVARAQAQAQARYQPTMITITGDTVLYKAAEVIPLGYGIDTKLHAIMTQLQQQPDLGWYSWVGVEALTIEIVPGHHYSVFAEPHVQVMAKLLQKSLLKNKN